MESKGLEEILSDAVKIWKENILYNVLFSILYFTILLVSLYLLNLQFGVVDELFRIFSSTNDQKVLTEKMMAFANTDEAAYFSIGSELINIYLFPLCLGLYSIYLKKDQGLKPEFKDLLNGYNGLDFLRFAGFFMVWLAINSLLKYTVILPIVWQLFTMMCSPILFFERKSIFESISESYRMVIRKPGIFIACFFIAAAVRYGGMLFFMIGIVFTFPFWMCILYALYRELRGVPVTKATQL